MVNSVVLNPPDQSRIPKYEWHQVTIELPSASPSSVQTWFIPVIIGWRPISIICDDATKLQIDVSNDSVQNIENDCIVPGSALWVTNVNSSALNWYALAAPVQALRFTNLDLTTVRTIQILF